MIYKIERENRKTTKNLCNVQFPTENEKKKIFMNDWNSIVHSGSQHN